MVWHKNQKKATPEELAHLALIKQQSCCVCSPGMQKSPTEVHHCLSGGKRISHLHTLPLCKFHHHNVSQLRNLERTYWEMLMERLNIKHIAWPESKLVPRRAT